MPINLGDDRRRLVPSAVVQVLTILIDELDEWPEAKRMELRSIRSRLCRVYALPDPLARANSSAVAQMMEDADGVPLED